MKAEGNISIEVWIDCPHDDCNGYHNILDDEFMRINDDGYIYKNILTEEGLGCDNLDVEIECPECGKEIEVGRINW